MVVYVVPGERQTRAAFLCSRRVGGAVVRNRARRLLREAWRALAPRALGAFDVVFVARPEIQGAKTQDLIADMDRALAAAGVIGR
jgi:ribonuclease P protein component